MPVDVQTEVEINRLYDTEASRANILKAFARLNETARPEDVVIIYFAGHGDIQGSSGLGVVLTDEMDHLIGAHASHQCDFVGVFAGIREKRLR